MKGILLRIASFSACVSLLASCTLDPYEIPAKEEYTRNFIKEFGLIDPNQNFNLAQSSSVTVKLDSPAREVKAYMKVDGTYWLVAGLNDVSGTFNIPFDMPPSVTDILVKIDGKRYHTTPGGTVNLAPASRVLNTDGGPGVSITLLPDERADGGVNYLSIGKYFLTKFTEVLEEDGNNHGIPTETNLIKEKNAITENFLAKAQSFWIFPEYWQTSNSKANTIGVYYYVSAGTEGATKVVDENGDESWVVKVPIYAPDESKSTEIVTNLFSVTGTQKKFDWYDNTNNCEEWNNFCDGIFESLLVDEKLPEGWSVMTSNGEQTDGDGNQFAQGANIIRFSADAAYFDFSDYKNIKGNIDKDDEASWSVIARAAQKSYPTYNFTLVYNTDSGDGYFEIVGIAPGTAVETQVTGSPTYIYTTFFKSKAIEITFDKVETFGFYIERDNKTKYSEARLNETLTYGGEVYTQACYVCTFTQGTDTYGNTLRHLCFEDWFSDAIPNEDGTPGTCEFGKNTNFDMNDMVFRVYGFDEMVTHPEITPGEIDDTPDEPSTPEPSEPEPIVEEPYHWLLAVEDLGATDDFDFNDIVISISANLTTETPATGAKILGTPMTTSDGQKCYNKVVYKALAAGGTKSAYVYFNGILLYPDGREDLAEWHKWFDNGQYSSTTMINTGYGTDNCVGAECTIYYGVIDENSTDFIFSLSKLNPEYEAIDAVNSGFKIGVDNKDADAGAISTDYFTTDENGYYIQPTAPGEAPQMFLIPDRWNNDGSTSGTSTYDTGKWQWPMERHHIQSCYSDFKKWVSGDKDGDTWYQKAGSGTCRPSK